MTSEEIRMKISKNLEKYRLENGYTIKEFAAFAEVTPEEYNESINLNRDFLAYELINISECTNVKLNDIFYN
ncbi:hypothetical protein [Macrococcus equipercicus]|uniref:Uncharacterized protein n=1 Tax=Macrococcus equipercicus TaxID=69967 RepID=A0A9Q9BV86_9STAP|nr:hypothetical protein [Macrococcus equipercicus]UTH14781.1 hypothetical protein KFV11_05375 [Macrococcus equipercicus]